MAANSFINNSSRQFKNTISAVGSAKEDAILDQLRGITTYTYAYTSEATTTATHLGLITEEAPPEVLSVSGTGVDIYKLSTFTLAGLKALDREVAAFEMKLTSLASSTPSVENEGFVAGFFEQVFARVGEWLASAANGLTTVFAQVFEASEKICVDGECLTADDIRALLALAHADTVADEEGNEGADPPAQAGEGPTSDAPTSPADIDPPTLTLNGANPATILIGETYADMGASATDNVDTTLYIYASVDDGPPLEPGTMVTLDTSAVGEHTVTFTVTDEAGNTATASRTVVVEMPGSTSSPQAGQASAPQAGSDSLQAAPVEEQVPTAEEAPAAETASAPETPAEPPAETPPTP